MPVNKKTGKKSFAQQDSEIILGGLSKSKKKPTRGKASLQLRQSDDLASTVARQKGGRKYDWDAAREMYMTAQPAINMKQLSQRTGIPWEQIRNRAYKERWSAIRTREQMEILKQDRQRFLQEMGREAISFDQTGIDVAKVGMGIVAERLIEITRFMQAADGVRAEVIKKLQNGEPLQRGDLWGVANFREVVGLAQAAEIFQKIGRTALGTEVTDGALLSMNDTEDNMERVVSIGDELTKDDPDRISAIVEVIARMGLLEADTMEDDVDEETGDESVVLEGTFTEMKAIEGPKE